MFIDSAALLIEQHKRDRAAQYWWPLPRNVPAAAHAWMWAVDDAIRAQWKRGDPMRAIIMVGAQELAEISRLDDRGCVAVLSQKAWGPRFSCCRSTVVRVVRWLERASLIKTFRWQGHVPGQGRSSPNLYVLCVPPAMGLAP